MYISEFIAGRELTPLDIARVSERHDRNL